MSLKSVARDLDGIVWEENIRHDAGASTPQGLARQEILRLVREAGHEPFRQLTDTLYRPITRTETTFTVQV